MIEESTILTDDTPHMFFAQNQDMIQTFTAYTADEPFANGVCFGGIRWRVDQLDASPFDSLFKTRTKLVVVVTDQEAWPLTEWCGVAHLLSYPLIGGVARHASMHNSP